MTAQSPRFLALALESDRSFISYAILGLYSLLSLHWLYLVFQLSREQKELDAIYPLLESIGEGGITSREGHVFINDDQLPGGLFSEYLGNLVTKSRHQSEGELDHG